MKPRFYLGLALLLVASLIPSRAQEPALLPDMEIGADSPSRPVNMKLPIAIEFDNPLHAMLHPTNNVDVKFKLFRTEVGPHTNKIHLFVDENPFVVIDDVSKPYILQDVATGSHLLRALLVRNDGIAYKHAEAMDIIRFHIVEDDGGYGWTPVVPVLTINLPKTSYTVEEAKRLVVDLRIDGATMRNIVPGDFEFQYTLDDSKPVVITGWPPAPGQSSPEQTIHGRHIVLENIQPGTHKIKVVVLDADGNPTPYYYLQAEREFTVSSGEQKAGQNSETKSGNTNADKP